MRLSKWGRWVVVVLVGVALLFTGACAPGNNPPQIFSVSADPATVAPGEISTVACVATDPDGDTLTYSWRYSGPCEAAIPGTSSTVDWTVAGALGTYTVTVTVNDGKGGTDEASCSVTVEVLVTAGSIDVKSSPEGATVYVDGTDTGNITPYVITDIDEGDHTIKLSKEFCKDREETVTVTAGETTYVNWELEEASLETVTLQPGPALGKDTSVYEAMPHNNYGSKEWIGVGPATLGKLERSYLQFDFMSISDNAVVVDADLGLYYHGILDTVAMPIGAYTVLSGWEEGVITWAVQPAVSEIPEDVVTLPATETNDFEYWDVGELVQGWIDGSISNHGVMLRAADESAPGSNCKYFRSSNYDGDPTARPKLVITYYDPSP